MGLTYEEARAIGLGEQHPDHPSAPQKKKEKAQVPAPVKMTKPERLMGDFLAIQKSLGLVRDYKFESINLRLAQKCWYKPDWSVWTTVGPLLYIECKGPHQWDDARVKYKTAAEMYNHPFFLAVYDRTWKIHQLPGVEQAWRIELRSFFKGI